LTALRRTSDALALSDVSPLNARQRYNEADRQLEAQFKIAMGGGVAGQAAAQGIDSFIQNLLRESKNRFASGTPFASDYNRAQSMLDALEGIYGPQLTTEEKTLAELKKHTDVARPSSSTRRRPLVEQLIARANDHPDGDTVGQVSSALRRLGYALRR
jgi:hypothetical protein